MEFNSNRKAALAVTAGLVGALTLGGAATVVAAPQAAFADDAALQFVNPDKALDGAEVTYTLKHGTSETEGGKTTTFEKGVPALIDIKSVKIADGTQNGVDITFDLTIDSQDKFAISYYKQGEDGKPTGEAMDEVTGVGKYVAVVEVAKGDYAGNYVSVPFEITARKLTDLKADVQGYGFYDATAKDVKFSYKNESNQTVDLVEGIDYDVKYYVTGNDLSEKYASEIKNVGTYRAVVTGKDNYAGTVKLSDVITVTAFDLQSKDEQGNSQVTVEKMVSDSSSEPTAPDAVWYQGHRFDANSALVKELKAELKNKDNVWYDNGTYDYTVSPVKENDPNFAVVENGKPVVHTVDIKVIKTAKLATFTYNGQPWSESREVVNAEEEYSSAKVEAKDAAGKKLTVKKYLIDGYANETTGWGQKPGDHTVVYLAYDGTKVVGKAVVTLKVYEDNLDADAGAKVFYGTGTDKKVVTSVDKVYDGNDAAALINVYVVDKDGKEIKQSDSGKTNYEVSFYDANGTKVNKVVDAGTYTMKLTSSVYKLSGTTEMTIKVAKKSYDGVVSGNLKTQDFGDKVASNDVSYLTWTKEGYGLEAVGGKHFGLDLKYDADGDGKAETPLSSTDLSAYKVTFLKGGEEVKKLEGEGVYTVHFEARNTEYAKNYEAPADLTFTVIKDGTVWDGNANRGAGAWVPSKDVANHLRFADVTYRDYFVDAVDWAVSEDVMHGYGDAKNSSTFGPHDSLTRAQVAAVLYNLAGTRGKVETNPVYTPGLGYVTGFSDTDNFSWYAKAVAWAKQAGVVNGYGDGTFKPNAPVTREDFACMIANYAKKFGGYEAAGADALDKMPDASKVSGYAKSAVAWAVANKVMGNGGSINPTATIIRADCAGMVRNFAK